MRDGLGALGWVVTNHVKMEGTPRQARDYAFKEGAYEDKAGCVIGKDGVLLGELPAQGSRSDLQDYVDAVDRGDLWGEVLRRNMAVTAKYLGWAKEVHKTRKRTLPGPTTLEDLQGTSRLLASNWVEEWLEAHKKGKKTARNVGFISGPAHGSGKSTVAGELAVALTNMGYSVPLLSGKETLANVLNIYAEGTTPVIIFDLAKSVTHELGRKPKHNPPWDFDDYEDEWRPAVKPALLALVETLSDGGIRTSTKYAGANIFVNSMVLVFTNLTTEEIKVRWPNRGLIYSMGESLIEMYMEPV